MWFLIKNFEHVHNIQHLNVEMIIRLAQIWLANLTEFLFF